MIQSLSFSVVYIYLFINFAQFQWRCWYCVYLICNYYLGAAIFFSEYVLWVSSSVNIYVHSLCFMVHSFPLQLIHDHHQIILLTVIWLFIFWRHTCLQRCLYASGLQSFRQKDWRALWSTLLYWFPSTRSKPMVILAS